MKNHKKLIFMLFILILAANTSCDKFSGDTDSISGSWRCSDESGSSGFRNYSVTIYKAGAGSDSTDYVINNFHNLGYEVDTYIQLIDTVITIKDINGSNVSGEGHVSRNFKTIEWEYTISGEFVTAFYRK